MIKARYTNEAQTGIIVDLADGDMLGSVTGPASVSLPVAPASDSLEHDQLDRLITDGALTIAAFVAPAPAVPQSVFDYQFAGEAEARGIITEDECDAWVGPGTVPQTLLTKVEQLITDPDTQRRVVLFLKGSKEFPRFHPNTVALAKLFGLDTDAKLDDFFIAAAER